MLVKKEKEIIMQIESKVHIYTRLVYLTTPVRSGARPALSGGYQGPINGTEQSALLGSRVYTPTALSINGRESSDWPVHSTGREPSGCGLGLPCRPIT